MLFAIVVGAAVGMQQLIKMKLQGASNSALTNYSTEVAKGSGLGTTNFEPTRTADSKSQTDLKMDSSKVGRVSSTSTSTNIENK